MLLKCVEEEDADYILREIHEGVCGNHSGGRTLAYKALRQGYYWPTMKRDALQFVKKWDKCQRFATIPKSLAEQLSSMTSPCPFAIWGIDLISPLPITRGGVKFVIVAMDYFTKWAEAEPLTTITSKRVLDFVLKAIICRFGIPQVIVSDNGTQFDNEQFREFYDELGITKSFSFVSHP